MVEKYFSKSPPLTPYEKEVLTILMEECAEVIQAASKMIRFGREERPDNGVQNDQHLGIEIGELFEMINMTNMERLIFEGDISLGRARKRLGLAKYLQAAKPAARPVSAR